jgi:hypothetical protein
MWLRRTCSAVCLVIALVAALPAAAHAAAPANDDLADAQVVRVGDHLTGTVVDATIETGEPATSGPLIANTVWDRFDATVSERVRMDTCGSDRYAELAVYTGVNGRSDRSTTTARSPKPSGCRRSSAARTWTRRPSRARSIPARTAVATRSGTASHRPRTTP